MDDWEADLTSSNTWEPLESVKRLSQIFRILFSALQIIAPYSVFLKNVAQQTIANSRNSASRPPIVGHVATVQTDTSRDQPFFTSGQAESLSDRNASSPGITARSL
jgi:hypothetical protein